MKSRYSEILEEFGVPKTIIWWTFNVLLLILKYTSTKHHWGVATVGKVTRKIVREVISLTKI